MEFTYNFSISDIIVWTTAVFVLLQKFGANLNRVFWGVANELATYVKKDKVDLKSDLGKLLNQKATVDDVYKALKDHIVYDEETTMITYWIFLRDELRILLNTKDITQIPTSIQNMYSRYSELWWNWVIQKMYSDLEHLVSENIKNG